MEKDNFLKIISTYDRNKLNDYLHNKGKVKKICPYVRIKTSKSNHV